MRDSASDLAKSNIRLWLDGTAVTAFGYDPATDRLTYIAERLSGGARTVKLRAVDTQGLATVRTWSFRVNVAPTITEIRPADGAEIADRTPTIAAAVRDSITNLAKSNVRLSLDGNDKTGFTYDRTTDRLTFTGNRLARGQHSVKVRAVDAQGLVTVRTWTFRIS